ncbi:hypothetical protein L7F22_005061 [Adiantum nelumboides]|nr:hypothetical protein [Adiantum nelumboides]
MAMIRSWFKSGAYGEGNNEFAHINLRSNRDEANQLQNYIDAHMYMLEPLHFGETTISWDSKDVYAKVLEWRHYKRRSKSSGMVSSINPKPTQSMIKLDVTSLVFCQYLMIIVVIFVDVNMADAESLVLPIPTSLEGVLKRPILKPTLIPNWAARVLPNGLADPKVFEDHTRNFMGDIEVCATDNEGNALSLPYYAVLDGCDGRRLALLDQCIPKGNPLLQLLDSMPMFEDDIHNELKEVIGFGDVETKMGILYTDKSFFTASHVDHMCTMGWMLLLEGRKTFYFWDGNDQKVVEKFLKISCGMVLMIVTGVSLLSERGIIVIYNIHLVAMIGTKEESFMLHQRSKLEKLQLDVIDYFHVAVPISFIRKVGSVRAENIQPIGFQYTKVFFKEDRTSFKTTLGYTQYQLVFGKEAILPIEVQLANLRVLASGRDRPSKQLRSRILELERLELDRTAAIEHYAAHAMHRKKNKGLKRGMLVLRYDNRFDTRMDKRFMVRWEGPFLIYKKYTNGSYRLQDISGKLYKTRVNGWRLKPFFQRFDSTFMFDLPAGTEEDEEEQPSSSYHHQHCVGGLET